MSSQRSDWRERLSVNPSRMELEIVAKLESSGIQYRTQIEVPVTTADFYFATEPRPTLVFVDGKPHLTTAQMVKDEELRTLLRKRGYKVVELAYSDYSDRKRDELYHQLLTGLGQE
jgi:very-short-patch-repair endonuclease